MVESFGSTSLVQVGNNFYFYPVGGSSGPLLKVDGMSVAAGSIGVELIGAEQTASGYQVALRKAAGADQYTAWRTDSNGNVISNGTGGVCRGSSSVLK